MYISKPYAGQIFIAERSRRGSKKLRWSVMPVAPAAADVRIEPSAVPRLVRRRAYRMFWADRVRNQTEPRSILI